jgi:hypothetical protein
MSTSQAVAVLRIVKNNISRLDTLCNWNSLLNDLSYFKLKAIEDQFPGVSFSFDDKQSRIDAALTIMRWVRNLFCIIILAPAQIALGICILKKVGLFSALSKSLRLGIGISSILNVLTIGLCIIHLLISTTFEKVRHLAVSKFADYEQTKIEAPIKEIEPQDEDEPPLVQGQSAELSS